MQSWEEPMEPSELERTIVDVERVRHDTRHALNPIWYPNIAFGLFFAGTAIVALLDLPGPAASAYWVLGGLLAMSLVVRHYARVERALGVESPMVDASTFILLALVAGVVAANVLTEGDGAANAFAPLYVGAAGTIAMGLVLRDHIELAAGVAIAVVATGVAVVSPTDPGIWGNLGLGLALLVAGLVGRERA
jgi:hypothetical protein